MSEKAEYWSHSLIITDGDGPVTFRKRHGGLKYGGRVNYYLWKFQG